MARKVRKRRALEKPQLDRLINFFERHRAGRTNVEIGKIANVTPSTISMVLSGERVPSVKVIRQLAKVLRPRSSKKSLEEFTDEFLKLAAYEPSVVADIGLAESVAKRVDQLRVAYVVNEPFVDKYRRGFAVDLFGYVADVIGAKERVRIERQPSELQDLMEQQEADIVAAVFPTFQRRAFMAFSKPFPYLRVPLSALVRKGTQVNGGKLLTLKHVLSWTDGAEGLSNVKMLLVNGEVGHDFVRTFLKRVSSSNYELTESLDPDEIYRQVVSNPDFNLLLANMATCTGVYELAKGEFEPLGDDEILKKETATGIQDRYGQFPILAMYPVTFGLPKDDKDWIRIVDRAIDSLMIEGASLLVSLYKLYMETDKRFKSLCFPEDELVTSEPLREMFEDLFRAHGLIKNSQQPLADAAPTGT